MDNNASSSLSYYLNDYWDEVGDLDIMNFPTTSGGPWIYMVSIAVLIYCIRELGPRFMANRKPFDLKPLLLVINGAAFGASTICFFVGVYFTHYGKGTFDCSPIERKASTIHVFMTKNLGFLYFCLKVLEFYRPIVQTLQKKYVSDLDLLHLGAAIPLIYTGLKMYPGGIFMLVPYLDTFYQIPVHVYLLLVTADMEPSKKWTHLFYYIRIVSGVVGLVHGLYYLFVPNCGIFGLKAIQVLYSIGFLALYPNAWKRHQEMNRRHVQQKVE